MFRAFFLSLRQLDDRAILLVFAKSLTLTLLVLAAAGAALWFGLPPLLALIGHGLRGLAGNGGGWLSDGLRVAGTALTTAGSDRAFTGIAAALLFLFGIWVLFRAVAIAVLQLFGDDIVRAVEARYYPDAHAAARDVPVARALWMGLGSAARAILVNLLFVPIYLLLLVTGVGTTIAFFLVNAWLLGRDLGDMVAARHVARDAMPDWRARTWGTRMVLGAIGTALFLVPVFNFVAPVVAAAMATHLFHQRRQSA